MATNPTLDALASIAQALEEIDMTSLESFDDDDTVIALQLGSRISCHSGTVNVTLAGQAHSRSFDRPCDESIAHAHGCRNATELLQRTTLVSARTAHARIRLARLTQPHVSLTGSPIAPRYQAISQGLRSGFLPMESALLITDMLTHAVRANPVDLEAAEHALIQAATGINPTDGTTAGIAEHADTIRTMCRMWEQALDPDGAEPSEEVALRDRCLRLGPQKHGLVPITGRLLPEVAATLARIVDAVDSPRTTVSSNPEHHKNPENSPGSDQEIPRDPTDHRSPTQRRHDVLAMALNVAAQSTDMPLLGGAPITVLIQVSVEDLEDGKGPAWLHSHDGSLAPTSQGALRHGACSGSIHVVRQDTNGRVVSPGSPTRIFTANQRRAIAVRDAGCIIPGCTVPPSWCEIHHVQPHARGGPTHTDNGVMLCFYHHRTIDTNGWNIRIRQGTPEVKAPPWLDPTQTWQHTKNGQYLLTN